MQIQIEEHISKDFTAVFAVKTPPVGNTGLSHLTEHMVFRGSDAFPASHELFVVNSVLPASINASTQNGFTFFYITATDRNLFIQLLDFLYHGIIQIHYESSVVVAERDGVLRQELLMLESNPEYALQCAVWRGDTSDSAYLQIGGYSDTITTNDDQDISDYKQRYYQSEQLSLYISGPEFTMADRIWLNWPNIGFCNTHADAPNIASALTVKSSDTSKQDTRVISWWIPAKYQVETNMQGDLIRAKLSHLGRILIEEEVNHKGQFAIRLIIERDVKSVIKQAIEVLSELKINASRNAFFEKKFPNEVNRLIYHFLLSQSQCHLETKKFVDCLFEYTESSLNKLPELISSSRIDNQSAPPLIRSSKIAAKHPDLISITNIPPVPRYFDTLLKRLSGNDSFVCEENNWLYKLDLDEQSKLLSLITHEHFWAPRLLGNCYALGLGLYEQEYFIYCAQDTLASQRANWCRQQFI